MRSIQDIEFVSRSTRHLDTSFGSNTSHDDILGNGLSEAVTDFEEALSRTRPEARTLSYSIPDSKKFHTFPRIKPTSKEYHHHDTTTIGLMSSGNCLSTKGSTTSTSASTVIMKEATTPPKDTQVVIPAHMLN